MIVRVRAFTVVLSLIPLLASSMSSAGQLPGQEPSPFLGSVPTGEATGTTLQLPLRDALDRALKHNLGLIQSDQDTRTAHATRLRSLSDLLPDVSGQVSGTREQISLKAAGFDVSIPGLNIPSVVGPFSIADARLYVSQQIFNLSDIRNWKSAAESERAARYSYKSDRDLVVLAAGNAYLVVISDHATVESTRAQVTTAGALHDRARDQNQAGVVAGIDVLRAQVELQTQQQRLIAAESQLAIDKLALARIIGLPKGQPFEVTDTIPFAPLDGITLDQALSQAYATRPDYLGAHAHVRAAELARQSAVAANYPWLSTEANYGDIGSPNFGSSHGTFSAALTLNVPIFQGTRVRADTLKADAALKQRKAELADLDGKVDEQVRVAFLKLASSSDLVTVAQSNIGLANQTLTQARDRFSAGVAANLEVVQAQESVAAANQSYIASLYAYNFAKISLAQAIGIAEQSALTYLGAK
ncbi:MAG TPA: TolC family protein [Vicinamibacterales bacterium]|nr:TolC family protein [Vicinamibacterales bacterium]